MKTQYKRFIAFWLVLFVITCATLASSSATQANYSGNSGDIASNQPQATTDDSLENYVVLPETLPCVTAGEKPIAEATIAERDAEVVPEPEEMDVATMRIEYLANLGYSVNGAAVAVVDRMDYTEDDLLNLAKTIELEAGSDWLSDHHQLMVGNVVLNRVESSEFPDTIIDVLAQPKAYASGYGTKEFREAEPSERAKNNARLLLEGVRVCPPSIVFQANFLQGSALYERIDDDLLGPSYFCYATYMEHYADPDDFLSLIIPPTSSGGLFL